MSVLRRIISASSVMLKTFEAALGVLGRLWSSTTGSAASMVEDKCLAWGIVLFSNVDLSLRLVDRKCDSLGIEVKCLAWGFMLSGSVDLSLSLVDRDCDSLGV
jgi:hypothetical protein